MTANITPPEAAPKAPAKPLSELTIAEREDLFEFLRELGQPDDFIERVRAHIENAA